MPEQDFVWWIEEALPPTSSEGGRKRLKAFGPYGSEAEANAKSRNSPCSHTSKTRNWWPRARNVPGNPRDLFHPVVSPPGGRPP